MNAYNVLIVRASENVTKSFVMENGFFSFPEQGLLWAPDALEYPSFLEKLVFHIARKPKRLITHLQRIYYCFHANLNEPLFAAIVDFLIVLNKCGLALSWRILFGAKSKLTVDQFRLLKSYLKDEQADVNSLPGNRFSIFTRGLLGGKEMVRHFKKEVEYTHDPLELARDYIEYSQLEEAKQLLELAILEQPARLEIHQELLALYRSTRDTAGFKHMLAELTQLGVDITDDWNQLGSYLKGLNRNG